MKIKKWLLFGLIALACIPSAVLAVTYLDILSGHVTVTSGESQARFYSDEEATDRIMDIYPSLEPNQAWVDAVYVKNEGISPLTVDIEVEGNTAFGMVYITPGSDIHLEAGQIVPLEVTVYALPTALLGEYNISLVIVGQ